MYMCMVVFSGRQVVKVAGKFTPISGFLHVNAIEAGRPRKKVERRFWKTHGKRKEEVSTILGRRRSRLERVSRRTFQTHARGQPLYMKGTFFEGGRSGRRSCTQRRASRFAIRSTCSGASGQGVSARIRLARERPARLRAPRPGGSPGVRTNFIYMIIYTTY